MEEGFKESKNAASQNNVWELTNDSNISAELLPAESSEMFQRVLTEIQKLERDMN